MNILHVAFDAVFSDESLVCSVGRDASAATEVPRPREPALPTDPLRPRLRLRLRDGERERYRPASLSSPSLAADADRRRPCRKSGDDSRDEDGVPERGERDDLRRRRLADGEAMSTSDPSPPPPFASLGSSSCIKLARSQSNECTADVPADFVLGETLAPFQNRTLR